MIHDKPPKYPSTPHWPWSKTVHRDDSYHSYALHFLNKPVIITEKIDGGNTCLWNGDVYARSTSAPSHAGWMAMVRKHFGWKTVQIPNTALYGEDIYGVHSIEYDPVIEEETFYLFAVRKDDTFLSWFEIVNFSMYIDCKTVPLLFDGKFDTEQEITDFMSNAIEQPSILGGSREGLVMRVKDEFQASTFDLNVCKYVRPNHVQTDEHWTRNWRPCKIKTWGPKTPIGDF